MKNSRTHLGLTSYLDVSEFIIKEHSPLFRPASPPLTTRPDLYERHQTPEIAPIDHDTSQFTFTPMNNAILDHQSQLSLQDFMLDGTEVLTSQSPPSSRKKSNNKREDRYSLTLQMFRIDCQLQKIVEDDAQCSENCDENEESEEISEEEQCWPSYGILRSVSGRLKQKTLSCRDTEQQKQSTIELSIVDYSETIELFTKNPKVEIIKRIRQIQKEAISEDDKKELAYKFLEKYLLEYEVFCFEEAWKELDPCFKTASRTIIEGVEETFTKKMGAVIFQHRRVKLLKYLQKKKKRIWRKKVSYDCRKKVADGRLRIKGKFVTREQACQQLGLKCLDNYSPQEIKQMLQRKIDESLNQSYLLTSE